ncbi:MAG: cysteine desulfurase [Oscillospiraceae bacterium]|nr:cysteine desulfurase [Oscillospiraceae bacterium]
MSRIYLDYTADTPVDERVLSVYTDTARECFANPNSAHSFGYAAKQIVDDSLAEIAALLRVSPDELIFTSGASEANNLAVKGIAFANRRRGRHIISTFLEHSSVSGALTFLQEQGWEIDLVNIQPDGKIDLTHLKSLLRQDTVLCAVCAVDSELGTVQPVHEITEILKDYPNCRLHIDATQAVGKIPLDLSGVHTACFAPHKFYGLKGCGVLYKAKGVVVEPLIHGGASTTIYRSGTPDAPAAAACAKALELAVSESAARMETVTALHKKLRAELAKNPRIRINSPENAVPHILNLSVSGIKGEEMRRLLDERDIAVSVKSACSVPNTPSRAVMAITHDRKNALSSWRISLSHLTTDDEIARFVSILNEIISEVTNA